MMYVLSGLSVLGLVLGLEEQKDYKNIGEHF